MLTSPVLVVNQSYLPVHITSVKRAFCMLCRDVAKVVDREYQTFDFEGWQEVSIAVHDETVGMVDRMIKVPRVILLTAYNALPKREVRFSRLNVMVRDGYTCQYCRREFKRHQLNLDHVVPRSLGGLTTWENVVTSCHRCNHKKGGRTPDQASMNLARKPKKPSTYPFSTLLTKGAIHTAWRPYLNMVDFSYWNVELRP